MLTRYKIALFDGALLRETALAFQEQLDPFAPAKPTYSPCVTCQKLPPNRCLFLLNAPALRRAAAIMRDRRHVPDGPHFQSSRLQRPNGGLASRTRPLHQNIAVLHAVLIADGYGCAVGRLGGSKRGAFSTSPKAPRTRRRTGQDIPFQIADGNPRVVKSGLDMDAPVNHGLPFFLSSSLGSTFSLRHLFLSLLLARIIHRFSSRSAESAGLTRRATRGHRRRTLAVR